MVLEEQFGANAGSDSRLVFRTKVKDRSELNSSGGRLPVEGSRPCRDRPWLLTARRGGSVSVGQPLPAS